MLGALLRIREQFVWQVALSSRGCLAAPACSGNGPHRNFAVAHPDENFGA